MTFNARAILLSSAGRGTVGPAEHYRVSACVFWVRKGLPPLGQAGFAEGTLQILGFSPSCWPPPIWRDVPSGRGGPGANSARPIRRANPDWHLVPPAAFYTFANLRGDQIKKLGSS